MPHVFAYDHRHDLPLTELALVIGGKAANIATMATELGLPVPPAFTITTAACNAYLAGGWPDGLDAEIREHMARLETLVGRRFGDPSDPLLVSVRSGAPRSMPGMMDTILNLGLNRETEAGLAAASGDAAFARDCHDRFHKIYRDVVGVHEVPSDPWDQLRGAIEAVFRSWNSDRARAYREHEGISDALGTGVTVQAMVFGNRGDGLRHGRPVHPQPGDRRERLLRRRHVQRPGRGRGGRDARDGAHLVPGRADAARRGGAAPVRGRPGAALPRLLRHRVHHRAGPPVDAPGPRRQADARRPRSGWPWRWPRTRSSRSPARRPCAASHRSSPTRRRPSPSAPTRGRSLATGLPASPGVACGEICLTPEAAVAAADAGRDAILVRAETSPDDVHGMSRARGILTTTGGLREPRGGRRPRLGDPGRRRGVRGGHRRRDGDDRRADAARPERSSRSTARPARCSRVTRPASPRSSRRRGS